MRVNFYFRNKGKGNYSIENVFYALIKELGVILDVKSYWTLSPIDIKAILTVRRLKADIHHITGAINYLAFGLPRKRTIITVHDIGHYSETINGWRKLLYKYFFWVLPLRRARKITAISCFTKEQLIKHFGVHPEKITVIPNPVNPNFKFIPPNTNAVPVILQIGAGHNKNVEILIQAVKRMKVKLLLIRTEDGALVRLLRDHNISHEFRYNLSEVDLISAYAHADIVYFASTYEGFGLPILESMAIGRPVITSCISPMKDVALDNALLVDPLKVEDIRQAIESLLNNRELYNTYQERGLKHVESFRIDKIATQYQDLYKKLVSE